MSWDAIGAIGQAVSALALIVVIVQVGYARAEFARTVSQARTDGVAELMSRRASDALWRRAYAKMAEALEGPPNSFVEAATKQAGVAPDEAFAVFFDEFAFWFHRANTFNNVNRLSAGARTEFDTSLIVNYQTHPVSRLWYESMRSRLNPEFVGYIDDLLARPMEGAR